MQYATRDVRHMYGLPIRAFPVSACRQVGIQGHATLWILRKLQRLHQLLQNRRRRIGRQVYQYVTIKRDRLFIRPCLDELSYSQRGT